MTQFSREVFLRAKAIAADQGQLAPSPGHQIEGGSVIMCAAACIGYAAIQIREGISAADNFRRNIALPFNSGVIENAFQQTGLDVAVCSRIRIENDSKHPDLRLRWFLNIPLA